MVGDLRQEAAAVGHRDRASSGLARAVPEAQLDGVESVQTKVRAKRQQPHRQDHREHQPQTASSLELDQRGQGGHREQVAADARKDAGGLAFR